MRYKYPVDFYLVLQKKRILGCVLSHVQIVSSKYLMCTQRRESMIEGQETRKDSMQLKKKCNFNRKECVITKSKRENLAVERNSEGEGGAGRRGVGRDNKICI